MDDQVAWVKLETNTNQYQKMEKQPVDGFEWQNSEK